MPFERMTAVYERAARDRIARSIESIKQSDSLITYGRVLPGAGDQTLGNGRRIEAAILFLDLCASSQRNGWTEHDQENLLRAYTLFFGELVRIVEEHDGTVEKNTGDGLLAYFTKTTDMSASQKAVACAMSILRVDQEYMRQVIKNTLKGEMQYRITIDKGPITIAELGAPRRFRQIVAIGTAANIAAKMLKLAGPDQIVVGKDVVDDLPAAWRQHCTETVGETGFTYISSGLPYPAYAFTGKWSPPQDA